MKGILSINIATIWSVLFCVYGVSVTAMEDRDFIAARKQAHTQSELLDERTVNRNRIVRAFLSDVQRSSYGAYGSTFEETDAAAITLARESTIDAKVEAVFAELCERLDAGDTNLIALAGLITKASDVEKDETQKLYAQIYSALSDGTRTILEKNTVSVGRPEGYVRQPRYNSRLDYAALAVDVPEYMWDMVRHMCGRFQEMYDLRSAEPVEEKLAMTASELEVFLQQRYGILERPQAMLLHTLPDRRAPLLSGGTIVYIRSDGTEIRVDVVVAEDGAAYLDPQFDLSSLPEP